MAGPMSVSMTIKVIDEASGPLRSLTGAVRDLESVGESLNAIGGRSNAGHWNAEREAVQGVTSAVRSLGAARQNTAAIAGAAEAYHQEASAVQGVVDKLGALRAATGEASTPIGAAVGKLREEAAAVEAVTAKMRELEQASRPAHWPALPAEGPIFAGMNRPPLAGQPDLGAEAGRNRDWGAYWAARGVGGEPSEPPSATHPEPPRATEAGKEPAAGGGLISMMVGGAELASGWKVVKESYHEAADAAGQASAMRAAGVPEAEAGELTRAAREVSAAKGVFSDNEVLEIARDARTILGATSHAVEALPRIVDLATLAEAQRPGEGREGVMSLLKGMETSGATVSPESFGELAQSLAKVTNVFGKTIGFSDWGQYFKYGGTATQHFSPEFTEQKAPHLIQELTGSSAGTMLQTMYRTIVGGRMDKGAKEAMGRYGLYDAATEKVKGADVFLRDPSEWVTSVLKPTMDAAHLSAEDRAAADDKMFSSRLTARGISILENQDANVQKNAAQIRAARGLEAAPDLVRENPALRNRTTEAQGSDFARRAGAPLMGPLMQMQNAVNAGLVRANELFDRVPGSATAAAAGIVSGAGFLGWKTWESGMGNTVRSILRLPETAGKGLIEGVKDGVKLAVDEAPRVSRAVAERAGSGGVRAAGEAVTAGELGAAAAAGVLAVGAAGLIKAAADAQAPGMGGQWSPATAATRALDAERLEQQQQEVDRLRAEIDRNKRAERLPGTADTLNLGLQQQLDQLLAQAEHTRRSLAEVDAAAAREAGAGRAIAPPTAPSIAAMVAPLDAGIKAAVAGAMAAMHTPTAVPTAAQAPQNVTNNNQKTVNAPITVNAPVTVNATVNNTTPGAIGNAVAGAIRNGVRAGSAALHDGTETK